MNSPDKIESIWQQYTNGDKSRMKELYLYYYPELYSYGKSITQNGDIIDSAIQELFYGFCKKPPVHISNPEGYIFVSFRHQLYKEIESLKSDNWDNYQVSELGSRVLSAEDEIIRLESSSIEKKHIREALASLPARRKEAIYLRYFQNKSTKEISEIMGIREEMVRNYIFKGIRTLRNSYPTRKFLLKSLQSFLLISLFIKLILN